jgi:U3 small nucleolar RNA-associated protein 12
VGGESKEKSAENKAREYLAVALMDSTIRVYHLDTLRFYLKLYGHSLPVLAMAISDDGLLLASGGADKQVKLWGMDFGDCHRSLRARGDAITCLRFVPGTHYLWSGGKDGMLHMWDADTFDEVQRLAAHHSELWCMALSLGGGTMVTGSADCSVRVWKRTQEQLFLEEQRELKLDRQWERTLEEQQQRAQDETEGMVVGGDDEGDGTVTATTRVSLQTIKSGERLLEALQTAHPLHLELLRRLAEARRQRMARASASTGTSAELPRRKKARRGGADPAVPEHAEEEHSGVAGEVEVEVPTEFGGKQPHEHVLNILVAIRSAELETALLVLPLAAVLHLLDFLAYWLPRNVQPTLCCRVLFFLVRTFQPQLSSTPSVAPILMQLRDDARAAIQYQKVCVSSMRMCVFFFFFCLCYLSLRSFA